MTSFLKFTNIEIEKSDKNVEPLDLIDLRKFIGIQLLMGINRLYDERDHWCSDELINTPAIQKAMSRKRYFEIKRFLHFFDESSVDKTDSLYKVRLLLDELPKVSQKHYQMDKQL